MRTTFASGILTLLAGAASALGQYEAPPADILPIREITVFKDGHAMILRRGIAPTDGDGAVSFGDLPRPILGTFWAWEDEANATLHSVRAGRESVAGSRPPETIAELIEANVGANVRWEGRSGVIEAVLTKSVASPRPRALPEEPMRPRGWYRPAQSWAPSTEPETPPPEKTVLIRVEGEGTIAVPMESLHDKFVFEADPTQSMYEERTQEDRITMRLGWDDEPESQASVGVMYVERGLRWIPSYKITIIDDSTVRLDLQATLINEIGDLRDVTANLVVGVPSFAFEKSPDPMGLQDFIADLGPFFRESTSTAAALSNAIMTQVAFYGSASTQPETPPGIDVGGAESADGRDDLHIFTVSGITLARGERATIPLSSVELPCERVFTLDVPFAPPDDLGSWMGSERQQQIASQLEHPSPSQMLRITNTSEVPITTAPALIVRAGRPIAQNLIGYTPHGASVDVEMTAAVNIGVEIDERLSNRTRGFPWRGSEYTRVDTENAITLVSHKPSPITIEVTRHVLGFVDEASDAGNVKELTPFSERVPRREDWWWWGFNWPYWWSRANSFSTVSWTVRLEPNQPVALTWSSHYFQR